MLAAGTLVSLTQSVSAVTNLVWSDEFDGTTVNPSNWTYEIGNGCPNNCGWGNQEREYYTSRATNVFVAGGYLNIVALKENYNGFPYTSARLKSQGLYSKKYGYIEFRAKLPYGLGYWPALWMLGNNISSVGWPACGEIDIMENKGSEPTKMGSAIHYSDAGNNHVYQSKSYTLPSGGSVTNFNTYGFRWATNSMSFYVNGILIQTWTSWTSSTGSYPAPFNQPFYFIMNLAVGGQYLGSPSDATINANTVFPGVMQVDYVRVYDDVPPAVPPLAPTGLRASPGNAKVFLSWDTSTSGATSYNVKRATASGGPYSTIGSPTSANYTDSGVANCATYYYVVSGVNTSGESSNSTEAVASLSPYSLAVNSGGSAAGQFVADAYVTGGTQAAPSPNTMDTTGLVAPAPQAVYQAERYGNFTYTFTGLTPGVTYKVRLHSVESYWTAVGQRRFNLLINGTQVLTNFDIFAVTGAQNKATINEFMAPANGSGQIIVQFVTVTDNARSSGLEIILPQPSQPTGLLANAGDSQVALTWNATAGAASYAVKRSETGGGPYTTIASGILTTNYNDTGVTNGTPYYYVVSVVMAGCDGPDSDEINATPVSPFAQWQIDNFGSTSDPNAAAGADPDGDGKTNMEEFLSGTDPNDSASSLSITSIALEGSDIRVTWQFGSGPTNALQAISANPMGDYTTNYADIFIVTNTAGSVTNFLDPDAASLAPGRYYRVRLLP